MARVLGRAILSILLDLVQRICHVERIPGRTESIPTDREMSQPFVYSAAEDIIDDTILALCYPALIDQETKQVVTLSRRYFMILTAHQPAYLPWLGFFHKIALAEVFISLDNVQFEVNSWSNRNRIKTAAGTAWMTVPVRSGGHLHKSFAEIEIATDQPWQKKHWKSLESNYRRTLFWHRYADFFQDLYLARRWVRLLDLNDYMLTWFLGELGIRTPVVSALANGYSGSKNELIIDICRQLEGTIFVYGAQGRDYADPGACRDAGFEPYFQSYQPYPYPQLYGDFIPNLSIIDLLFNCGDASLDILMAGNIDRATLLKRICS